MKGLEAASVPLNDLVGLKAKKDPHAWAHKILARNAKGERVPRIAVEMAMEVVFGKDKR